MAKRARRAAKAIAAEAAALLLESLGRLRIEVPGLPPEVAKAFANVVRHAVAGWLMNASPGDI